MTDFKHIDISLDKENPDEGTIKEILKELRPEWKEENIKIQEWKGEIV